MDFNLGKRKLSEAIKPWIRRRKRFPLTPEEFENLENSNPQREKFSAINDRNLHFDIHTKCAASRAAPSIVCLQSSIGNEELFQCSGTIMESHDSFSIISTSTSLLRYSTVEYAAPKDIKITVHLPDRAPIDGKIEAFDHHFNLATVSINQSLPFALVTRVNDAISIDLNEINEEKSFHLRTHQSGSFELVLGDLVVALGRFITEPYELMAAPGEFCAVQEARSSTVIQKSFEYAFMISHCCFLTDQCCFPMVGALQEIWATMLTSDGDGSNQPLYS